MIGFYFSGVTIEIFRIVLRGLGESVGDGFKLFDIARCRMCTFQVSSAFIGFHSSQFVLPGRFSCRGVLFV